MTTDANVTETITFINIVSKTKRWKGYGIRIVWKTAPR